MNFSEAAQHIKEFVPVSRVLSLYGYTLSRDGFMRCPFHSGDRTASLKVYDRRPRRGWYCFGCHAGGSVIDFVMLHESCGFVTAVKAIDHHLSLGLLTVEPWDVQERRHEYQRLLDEAEHVLLQLADLEKSRLQRDYDRTWKLWHDLDLTPGLKRTADDWARWQNYQEGLYYLEYRLSKIDKLIMEVHSWRSRYRILSSNGSTHQKRMSPAV